MPCSGLQRALENYVLYMKHCDPCLYVEKKMMTCNEKDCKIYRMLRR